MAEWSMLWDDGIGDGGPYTEARVRDLVNVLSGFPSAGGGVLVQDGDLAVTSPGDNVIRIAPGWALVDGTIYRNDANLDINVESAGSGSATGCLVVLRKSWAAQTVRAEVLRNTEGITTIPAPTQVDGVVWELPLASFTVSTAGAIAGLADLRQMIATAGPPTPARIVAIGEISGASPPVVSNDVGIVSASRPNTGTYTVTFTQEVKHVSLTIVHTGAATALPRHIVLNTNLPATTITVLTYGYNVSNNPVRADISAFHVVAYA